jgi:hypothetical protein
MTLADFYKRVAQRLGVLPVAGTLSADDAEVVRQAYENLIHELLEHDLAFWNDDEDVPDKYSDPLIGMTAAMLVDEFTIPEPRRSQILVQHAFGLPVASVSERRLRALLRAPNTGTSAIEFY